MPSTAASSETVDTVNGASRPSPAKLAPAPGAGVSGEQCPNCAARLAPEQRYCVECGERRGQSRLPSADALGQRTPEAAAAPSPPRRARISANGALIAGVGTLLLAMGVGVLIGRSGATPSITKASPVQVIRVAGGDAGSAGASTTAAAAGAGGSSTSKKSGKHGKSASHAAPKTPATPPKAVKVGSPGSGPGYKNHKFTGDFFGQ